MSPASAADHKSRVREVFDGGAERYAREREGQPGFRRQADWVLRAVAGCEGRRVLEAGCGAGSLVAELAAAGFQHIALDLSPEMLRRFRERAMRCRMAPRAVRADAEALPFPSATFDVLVAVGLLEYLPEPAAFLREAARVLRGDGRLLLSVPSAISPHALASGLFGRLPHRLRARLLRRDPSQPLHVVRSRPARVGSLVAALEGEGFREIRYRFSHFVFFPLDRIAPRPSAVVSAWMERLGGTPIVSRLGAQILLRATRDATAAPGLTRTRGVERPEGRVA